MLHIIQLGSPRHANEGLRIGTVRRPPRGVRKERIAADNYYDVWLPQLAPSAELVKEAQEADSPKAWDAFVRKYRQEMAVADNDRLLTLLATMSRDTNFSVGCYCNDEARCHRSVLRELLVARGARVAP